MCFLDVSICKSKALLLYFSSLLPSHSICARQSCAHKIHILKVIHYCVELTHVFVCSSTNNHSPARHSMI